MMSNATDKSYFFIPRVGVNYSKGFAKKKTKARVLVLGAYHICKDKKLVFSRDGNQERSCPHRELCRTNEGIRQMDATCPCYANSSEPEYHRLSNSNNIELLAHICDDAPYPTYSAFGRYMLDKSDHLTQKEKERLWDSVAFTNMLQHYKLQNDAMDDEDYPFEDDYQTLVAVVKELEPEIVLAWNPAVKQTIVKHKEDFSYIGQTDMPGLSVYMFVPTTVKLTMSKLRKLKYEYGVRPERHRIEWYRDLVKKNLGDCFDVEHKHLKKTINEFAEVLKDAVDEGWFESGQDALSFRDSDESDNAKWKWTTKHKGYFLYKMKNIYNLKKDGTNAGFAKIFNEPNLTKYKNHFAEEDVDILIKAIDKGMQCGTHQR